MEEVKKIRVSLNRDTKEVTMTKTFEELKNNLEILFKDKLPVDYKLCYVDDDGDILTIGNNLDYETAVPFIRKDTKIIILPLDSVSTTALEEFEIVNLPKQKEPYEIINKSESKVSLYSNEGEHKEVISIHEEIVQPEKKLSTEVILVEEPKEEEKSSNTESKEEIKSLNSEEASFGGNLCCCLYCKGSGLNKKGNKCKKCNGTKKMPQDQIKRVRDIIKLELDSLIKSEAPMYASQIAMSQSIINSNIVHEKIKCDGCSMIPIKGIRYKCSFCVNYNLCELCERKLEHEHPMLKYRTDSQSKVASKVKESGGEKYQLEVVEVTYGQGKNCVLPGAVLVNKWKLKNTGTCSWPKGTALFPVNSSHPKPRMKSSEQVNPGHTIESSMRFEAPTSLGTYIWDYQLLDDKKNRIGSMIPFEFIVKESEEEEVRKELVKKYPTLEKSFMENLVTLAMMKTGHGHNKLLKILKDAKNILETAANALIDLK